MYQQLVDFKELHGHCNVPRSHPELGSWTNTQRQVNRGLKKSKNGKTQTMDPNRKKMLDDIGFEWKVP